MADITGLGGLTDYYAQVANKTQADAPINKALNSDLKNASDEELMEACKTFEAYFLEQVFKGMEKMVPKHEYEDAASESQMSYWKEQLTSEYAKNAVNETGNGTGLGLAQMLYDQMKRNIEG